MLRDRDCINIRIGLIALETTPGILGSSTGTLAMW